MVGWQSLDGRKAEDRLVLFRWDDRLQRKHRAREMRDCRSVSHGIRKEGIGQISKRNYCRDKRNQSVDIIAG